MAQTDTSTSDATGAMTGKPLIESDRVEGTAVFNRANHQIGTIQRLLIEKVSGRVRYVDVTFVGCMGRACKIVG